MKSKLVFTLVILFMGCAKLIPTRAALNFDPNRKAPAPVLNAGWAYDEVPDVGFNSIDSPYVYNLSSPATFTITDAFVSDDNYQVYDSGVLIFTTTAPGGPGDWTDDPDVAIADGGFSWGQFVLDAGYHFLEVRGDVASGGAPAGFFASITVPEPSTYLAGVLMTIPFAMQAIRHLRNRK